MDLGFDESKKPGHPWLTEKLADAQRKPTVRGRGREGRMSGPAEQKSPSQLASANWPKNKKRVPTAETLLTVSQVADNWQVSQRTLRRMISDGRLPVVRLGRAVRIREKEVAL
jgi:excisionase family DNA binding protein